MKKIALIPPDEVANAASHGLHLRSKFGRGGTEIGLARARQLKSKEVLAPDTIMRMVSYFARHEVDKDAPNFHNKEKPSNGYIAWHLWGGDAGREWADKMKRIILAKDE